jgi:hypothetical protein
MEEKWKYWLAGLIDGEGTITIAKYKGKGSISPYHNLLLKIGNLNIDLLKKIKEVTRCGWIMHDNRMGYRRPVGWCVKNNKALEIINEVYPILIVKKSQAEVAIEFGKLLKRNGSPKGHFGMTKLTEGELKKREDLFLKIKELNKKGRCS